MQKLNKCLKKLFLTTNELFILPVSQGMKCRNRTCSVSTTQQAPQLLLATTDYDIKFGPINPCSNFVSSNHKM